MEIGFLAVEVIGNDSSLIRKILDLSTMGTKFYSTTSVVLFCLLTYMASLQLRSIHQRLLMGSQITNAAAQLKILKRQHALICRTVEEINQNFGFSLLLVVCYIVIGIINNYMFILVSMEYRDWQSGILTSFIVFNQAIHLFLIAYVADQILNEVRFQIKLIFIFFYF